MKELVLYATRYGSTGAYAREIARRLSCEAAEVTEVDESSFSGTEMVVIGSPIYGFSVLPELEEFLTRRGGLLAKRHLAAFVVCGDVTWVPRTAEGGARNLEKLVRLLPVKPSATAIFGGRMRLEELSAEDRSRINGFYRALNRQPAGFDRIDLASVVPFVERISRLRRGGD